MEEFKTMETAALLDLLAKHTTEYSNLLADGIMDERFLGAQATIILLQSEILCRVAVID
jgi:hypothetical protein